MFQTDLPDIGKMLKSACRVVKTGSLIIILLGAVNRQGVPIGLKRIGLIPISWYHQMNLGPFTCIINTNYHKLMLATIL